MRIARFRTPDGDIRTGQLVDDRHARPLVGALRAEDHESGDFTAQTLRFEGRTVEVAALLAPIVPPNIFAIGRNYRAHAEETGSRVPEKPLIFQKPTTALNDPGGAIVLPEPAPSEVDFEAELVIVIGRTARRVTESSAMDHVLGYTCANDVSARDCQRNDKQWARAKGFDTFCPLGPWIVTPDALDPDACGIRSRLNGALMQSSNTSSMLHNCRSLVSYLSHQFTLLPGTLILTGTPEGVGFARKPPVFLKPGDRIEVEIDGIGTLANDVASH